MMKLANNHAVMGRHVNSKLFNFFMWFTIVLVSTAALLFVGSTIFNYVWPFFNGMIQQLTQTTNVLYYV